MKKILLANLLALTSFFHPAFEAQGGEDQSGRFMQIGQFRGLLDATCFYYQAGHLEEKTAMAYLSDLQRDINESFANGKLFKVLQDQVLREFPGCRQVWP